MTEPLHNPTKVWLMVYNSLSTTLEKQPPANNCKDEHPINIPKELTAITMHHSVCTLQASPSVCASQLRVRSDGVVSSRAGGWE